MPDVELADRRPVVVVTYPLSLEGRERLASQLGDVRVVDIREPVPEADLVLTPSCSPQAVAALKRAFPSARLVVTELVDDEFGVDLSGPVMRLLRAGADGYLTADGVEDLAAQLGGGEQPDAGAMPELSTPVIDDLILGALADRLSAESVERERER